MSSAPAPLLAMLERLSPAALAQLERVLGARLHVALTPAEERESKLFFLIELQCEHGRTPQRQLYDRLKPAGAARSQTLVETHGSWVRACRAATAERERLGHDVEEHYLEPLQPWKNPTRGRRRPPDYTDEEIIDAVIACAGEINRIPTSNAYYSWAADKRRRARANRSAPPLRIPTQRTIDRHFRGWDQVREATLERLVSS